MNSKTKISGSLAVAPKVITIPAIDQENARRLRVAAYARVSSDSTDQLHSFAAQNAYFSKLITSNPEWELADIYADKGITGTSIDKREDFLRMIEDCRKGHIDHILVKSISRFGRNTKESLEAVRELKSLGISVLFEEQNIDTAKADGEMLTAIFATLAQKESESISEKMRMSYQMRMQRGSFSTNSAPLGYRLIENRLEIVESEAQIVKQIFEQYLAGDSMDSIAKKLMPLGYRTKAGKLNWNVRGIQYILQNEKYVGDSLVQKTVTSHALPHKKKRNGGEQDQHPPIVNREVFERAQQLIEHKNAMIHSRLSNIPAFSCMIICGECGSTYKRKKYRNTAYWVCQRHDKDINACTVMQIPESKFQQAFLRLYFKIKHHGADILDQLLSDLRTARQSSLLWSEDIVELNKQISEIASQERLLAQLKQQGVVDPDIFISRTDALAERRREIKRKKELLLRSEEDHTIQQTEELLDILENGPDYLDSFDEELFREMVDRITVVDNETLRFRLINGMEVTEKIERTKR